MTLCAVLFTACGKSEKRETFHYNGIRKTRVSLRDGIPDGKFERWTSHGDLAESGLYKNGKREGEWTEWFANGKVFSRGQYANGEKQGLWKGFFIDGDLAWERLYENGKPSGIWTEYYPIPGNFESNGAAGRVKERNSCFPDAAEGFSETFSENGKPVRKFQCRYGLLHGTEDIHYPGGALELRSEYRDGLLNGKSELFRATGELWRRSFYKAGIRDSVWTYFAKDGSIAKQSVFQNGNGIAYGELGENGIDAETCFVQNRIQDTLRYKMPGHNLEYEEIWENGEKKKLLSHYASGGKAVEGNFSGGKRNGFWRNWHPNGKIKDSLFYKDGEPFGEQLHFDSSGNLYLRKNQYGKNAMEVRFR